MSGHNLFMAFDDCNAAKGYLFIYALLLRYPPVLIEITDFIFIVCYSQCLSTSERAQLIQTAYISTTDPMIPSRIPCPWVQSSDMKACL